MDSKVFCKDECIYDNYNKCIFCGREKESE